MKLSKIFFRAPAKMHVNRVQVWEVRWTSRHGCFSSDTREQVCAFPSREEAKLFASALKDAFKLIRHTSDTKVTIHPMD